MTVVHLFLRRLVNFLRSNFAKLPGTAQYHSNPTHSAPHDSSADRCPRILEHLRHRGVAIVILSRFGIRQNFVRELDPLPFFPHFFQIGASSGKDIALRHHIWVQLPAQLPVALLDFHRRRVSRELQHFVRVHHVAVGGPKVRQEAGHLGIRLLAEFCFSVFASRIRVETSVAHAVLIVTSNGQKRACIDWLKRTDGNGRNNNQEQEET
mmetsp:Transcript_13447/g.29122  ORF Transcript_13447/g.29122 Transcript_13447/m.29122 type:complete len:209 (+) Transcript_13447:172-798(+)